MEHLPALIWVNLDLRICIIVSCFSVSSLSSTVSSTTISLTHDSLLWLGSKACVTPKASAKQEMLGNVIFSIIVKWTYDVAEDNTIPKTDTLESPPSAAFSSPGHGLSYFFIYMNGSESKYFILTA